MKLSRVKEHLFRSPAGRYYVVYSLRGQKQMRSLRTGDRRTAERLAREHLDSVRGLSLDGHRTPFGSVLASWRSTVFAAADLKPLSREYRESTIAVLLRTWPGLSTLPVSSITPADCERWFAGRKAIGSPQRVNNELGTLRMILQHAVREKLIASNPASGLHRLDIPPTRIVIPSRDQFDAVIAHLLNSKSAEGAWFCELLAYSGMRLHEAVSLRWDDVDFIGGQFHVTGGDRGTKNRRTRWVPLFPPLRELLTRIPKTTKPTVLFTLSCKTAINNACQALSIPHFTHHTLRHFFVSNAIESGIDYKTIADWIGHSDGGILVARLYGHLRREHSHKMAEKMNFSASMGKQHGERACSSVVRAEDS